MLWLHGDMTGNCIRAAIALEEAGVDFTPVKVDLRRRAQKDQGYLALNPEGKVPVLVGDAESGDFRLSQSNAIMLYAAELAPGKLLPVQPGITRALAWQRYFYILTEVVENLQSTYYLHRPGNQDAARTLVDRAISALIFADAFVMGSRFMAGEDFTLADVAAVTLIPTFTKHLPWEQIPNLQRWFGDVSMRPAVLRGLHAFDEL